jgi:hypothetical protein
MRNEHTTHRAIAMPRIGRTILPDHPHHIVQRGQLTGRQAFIDRVESILGKRTEHRSRGRPTRANLTRANEEAGDELGK